jgi:Mrp family chromosome partitioning ATPase
VLDTPPLVPVCDAAVMSRVVDGLLVVVAAHETTRKQLGEALSLLDESEDARPGVQRRPSARVEVRRLLRPRV